MKTLNKPLVKALRRHPTEAEKKLWRHLRNRQISGAKFRRQQPFGPYILDFYCAESKLAIELDGGQHGMTKRACQDEQRDRYLRQEGVTVLRLWNNQLFDEFEEVLNMIYTTLENRTPHPNPLPPKHDWRRLVGLGSPQGERGEPSARRQILPEHLKPLSPKATGASRIHA